MSVKREAKSQEKHACLFCVDIEPTASHNRRKHCKSKHTSADVVDRVLPNGLKFRRDTDRTNLLISLIAEGSTDNVGYCFDCYSEIRLPPSCKNKIAYIQSHQCKPVKERKKRTVTDPVPSGKFVAPVAPTGKRTKEDLIAIKKACDDLQIPFHDAWSAADDITTDGDDGINFKQSEVAILKVIKMMVARIKADYQEKLSTPTSGTLSIKSLINGYCMTRAKQYPGRCKALRAAYELYHDDCKKKAAMAEDDSDSDEETEPYVYIEGDEDTNWMFNVMDIVFTQAKPKGSKELEEANAEIQRLTNENTEVKQELYNYIQSARGLTNDLSERDNEVRRLQEQVRILKAKLTEEADTITHNS